MNHRAPCRVKSHRVEERAVAQQHAKTIQTVGLDFGTTNSALAVVRTDWTVQLATFQDNGQVTTTFRSVLYFLHPEEDDYREPRVVAGPQAIRSYRSSENELEIWGWFPGAHGCISHRTLAKQPKRRIDPCASGYSSVAPPSKTSPAVCNMPISAMMCVWCGGPRS